MAPKHRVRIDGSHFSTLEGFFQHFAAEALDHQWGQNLDAFNDVLRGGFGTPEVGFVIEWVNHNVSRQSLGYPETVRQLQLRLERCHPSNIPRIQQELAAAQRDEGPTAYDWLIEIIRDHCPGGSEEEDGIELVLN